MKKAITFKFFICLNFKKENFIISWFNNEIKHIFLLEEETLRTNRISFKYITVILILIGNLWKCNQKKVLQRLLIIIENVCFAARIKIRNRMQK